MIDVECMAIYQVVRVFLRKTFGEGLESLAAIPRAVDDDTSFRRITLFVFNGRYEPGPICVRRMNNNGKAKGGWLYVLDLLPGCCGIDGFKDSIVMLGPNHVGIRAALREHMRILCIRLELALQRHVLGAHSLSRDLPCIAA